MEKYTNTAGFKGVSEENTEESTEKLPRPLFFLIIGGIVAVVVVAFLIVHAVTSNQGEAATADEASTVAAATEDYDYNELFGLEESTAPSEPITINPQSAFQSMTIAVPQPITQPVTTTPQQSEASSRTESQMARSESSTPQQSHSDSTPRSQPSQQSSASESHQVPQ